MLRQEDESSLSRRGDSPPAREEPELRWDPGRERFKFISKIKFHKTENIYKYSTDLGWLSSKVF